MLSISPRRPAPALNRSVAFTGKHGTTASLKQLMLPVLLLSSSAAGLAMPAKRAEVQPADTFALTVGQAWGLAPDCNVDLLNHTDSLDIRFAEPKSDQADAHTEIEPRIPHGKKQTKDILKCPPFSPENVNLFMPQVYSQASTPVPAAPKPVDEKQLLNQLAKLWGNGNKKQLESLFNHKEFKAVVPDPRLRAAILSLKGTAAESAMMDAARKRVFSQVIFKDLPSGIVTAMKPVGKDNKPEMYINSRYQHERPEQLSIGIAHEILHQDDKESIHEERTIHGLTSLVYAQQIQRDPSLARSATELAKRQNTELMARLNSRDPQGNLRIFTAKSNVYPGGLPLSNYGAAFTSKGGDTQGGTEFENTPGNSALGEFVKDATGVKVRQPNFDDAMEAVMDKNQKALRPDDVIAAAKALQLKADC